MSSPRKSNDLIGLWARLLTAVTNCPPGTAAVSKARDTQRDPLAFWVGFDDIYNKLEALSVLSPLTRVAWVMLVRRLKVPNQLAKLCSTREPCRTAAAVRALNLLLQSAVEAGLLPSDPKHWSDKQRIDYDLVTLSTDLTKQLADVRFVKALSAVLSFVQEDVQGLQASAAAHAQIQPQQDPAQIKLIHSSTWLARPTVLLHQPVFSGSPWGSVLSSTLLQFAGELLGVCNKLQSTYAAFTTLPGLQDCVLPAGGLAVAVLQCISTCLDLRQCPPAALLAGGGPGETIGGHKPTDYAPIIQDCFQLLHSVATTAKCLFDKQRPGPSSDATECGAAATARAWAQHPGFWDCLHTLLLLAAHMADMQQASCGSSSSSVDGSSGAASAGQRPVEGSKAQHVGGASPAASGAGTQAFPATPSLISNLQCFQRSLQLLGYSKELFSAIPPGMEMPQPCTMYAFMDCYLQLTDFAKSARSQLQLPADGKHAELHLLLPPIVLAWAAGQPGLVREQPSTTWGWMASTWGAAALSYWEKLRPQDADTAADAPPAVPAAIAAALVRETVPRVLDVLAAAVAAPQPDTPPSASSSNLQAGCTYCGAQAILSLALLIQYTPVSAQYAPVITASAAVAAASNRAAAACSAAAWRKHAPQLNQLLEAVLRLQGGCAHCLRARNVMDRLRDDAAKYEVFFDFLFEPNPDSLFQHMFVSAPLNAHSRQSKCMQLLLGAAVAAHQPKAQLRHCSLLSTLIKHSTSLVCAAGELQSSGPTGKSNDGSSSSSSPGSAAEREHDERLLHSLTKLDAVCKDKFGLHCLLGTTRGVCAALHAAWLAAPPGGNSSCAGSAGSRDSSLLSGDSSVRERSRDGSVSSSNDGCGCNRKLSGVGGVPTEQAADAAKHALLQWQSVLAGRCCIAWAACMAAWITRSAAQASKATSPAKAAAAATGRVAHGAHRALKAKRTGASSAPQAGEGSPAASPSCGSWCHKPAVWVELYALLYSCSSWLDQMADQQQTGFDAASLKHEARDAMRLCSEVFAHLRGSSEEACMPFAHAQRAAVSVGEFGRALSALVTRRWCNDPCCANMSGASELQLVAKGRSKVCGGCRVARYCGRECQVRHWPMHKLVCKQLQLAAAQKPAAEV